MCGPYNSYNICNPCNHFGRVGASVSRWCSDGGFDSGACCLISHYAYLIQTDAFAIAANDPIPFTGANVMSNTFELANGELVLPGPGVYCVQYSVMIPSAATANTSFVLRLDGMDIAGTQRTVANASGEMTTVTAQAIVEVCETAVLGLYSTAALMLPTSVTGDPLVTLTVTGL